VGATASLVDASTLTLTGRRAVRLSARPTGSRDWWVFYADRKLGAVSRKPVRPGEQSAESQCGRPAGCRCAAARRYLMHVCKPGRQLTASDAGRFRRAPPPWRSFVPGPCRPAPATLRTQRRSLFPFPRLLLLLLLLSPSDFRGAAAASQCGQSDVCRCSSVRSQPGATAPVALLSVFPPPPQRACVTSRVTFRTRS